MLEQSKGRNKIGIILVILIVFIVWYGLFNYTVYGKFKESRASQHELYLASWIFLICCIPIFIYFFRSEKNIPYIQVFSIFYFTYFALSMFINYRFFQISYISEQLIIRTLNYVLLGIISLLVAFYSPFTRLIEATIPKIKVPWDYKKAYPLALYAGIIGTIAHYISMVVRIPLIWSGLVSFVTRLSQFSIAVFYMLYMHKRLDFKGKFFFFVIFISRLLLDLCGGLLFPAIMNIMIIYFLDFFFKNRVPMMKIIITILIVANLQGVKNTYRDLSWYGQYSLSSPIRKIGLLGQLFVGRLTKPTEEEIGVYDSLVARSDYLVTFVKVVEMTPQYVPYWGGYTYSTLITSFIPRFLMPDKPQKTLGQQFGHRFMLLDPQDTSTSYNLSLVIEMYINFGVAGIIIGMFILGLIFRIIYVLLNHAGCGEGGFILSVMMFIYMISIEMDFSLMFGSIIQYTILFYIVMRRMKIRVIIVR